MKETYNLSLPLNKQYSWKINVDNMDVENIKNTLVSELNLYIPYNNTLYINLENLKYDYEFKKELLNYYFFNTLSNIIITYGKSNKLNIKDIYPIQLKQFILNLKFKSIDYNIVLAVDQYLFIELKTLIFSNMNYQNLIHEAYVCIKYINKLKYFIPNFIYTFGFIEASEIIINEERHILSWGNIPKNNNLLKPYILRENIEGYILYDYIQMCKNDDIINILLQYENAMLVIKYFFKDYENRGININNLIIRKTKSKYKIPIYLINSENKLISNNYLHTNIILYISNFEDSTINSCSNKISNYPDYNFDILFQEIINIRKDFKIDKIIYYNGTINNLKEYNIDLNFIPNNIEENNKELTKKLIKYTNFVINIKNNIPINDIIINCEEFINIIVSFLLENYYKHLDIISNIRNKIYKLIDNLNLYNINSNLYDTFYNTINIIYNKYPFNYFKYKIISYIPINHMESCMKIFSYICILLNLYINNILPYDIFTVNYYINSVKYYLKSNTYMKSYNMLIFNIIKIYYNYINIKIRDNTILYFWNDQNVSLLDRICGIKYKSDKDILKYNIYIWVTYIIKNYPNGDINFKELKGLINDHKIYYINIIMGKINKFINVLLEDNNNSLYLKDIKNSVFFRKSIFKVINRYDNLFSVYLEIINKYINNLNSNVVNYIDMLKLLSLDNIKVLLYSIYWIYYHLIISKKNNNILDMVIKLYFKFYNKILKNIFNTNNQNQKFNVNDFSSLIKDFDKMKIVKIINIFDIYMEINEEKVTFDIANKFYNDLLNI